MLYYKTRERESGYMIDHDIIAFHVEEDESEHVIEYLTAAIYTRCMMEFGETPEEL